MISLAPFEAKNFKIRYEAWGDPKHTPILFFHGFPGSHVQARGLVPFVESNKLFLIAADRPGYGETIGRGTPFDYLDDLADLLTSLKISKLHLLGVSGGAPWSHLMASRIAERISSHIVVCGLGPFNRETKQYFSTFQRRGLMIGRWLPPSTAGWLVNRVLRDFGPEQKMDRFLKTLDSTDQYILTDPSRRSLLMSSMAEARRQGAKGIVNDARLYQQDWLSNYCNRELLTSVATTYYHGRRDQLLDPRMSEWMHKRHGQSTLTMFDDEGHYSLPFQRAQLILEKIPH